MSMPSVSLCSIATVSLIQQASNGGPSDALVDDYEINSLTSQRLDRTSTPSRIGGIAARTDEGKPTLSVCSVESTTSSRIGGIAARTDEGKWSLSDSFEESATVVQSLTADYTSDDRSHGGEHFTVLADSYLDTPCRGSAQFFIIHPYCPNTIIAEEHHRRIDYDSIQKWGQYVFLENRSIPNSPLRDHNRNNMVVIETSGQFSLGVIESLRFRAIDEHLEVCDGILDVWIWSPCENSDTDQLKVVFEATSWDDIRSSFRHEVFVLGVDDFRLYFVNQVAGRTWNGGARFDVKDSVDGGIQSSRMGCDQFHPPIPKPDQLRQIKECRRITLTNDIDDAEFYYSEDGEHIETIRLCRSGLSDLSDRNSLYIQRFIRYKQVVFNYNNATNYHTISHLNGSMITHDEMRYSNPLLKGHVLIASPSCSLLHQEWIVFYVMTKDAVNELKHFFNGVNHEHPVALFEQKALELSITTVKYFVLNMRGSQMCSAIVFNGNSAPDLYSKNVTGQPDDWSEFLDIEANIVHRRLLESAGRFEDHPPISMSYMSQFTQNRQFDKYDLRLISKGINSRSGTFPVRSCSKTIGGSNSYFGQRNKKCRTMSSVSQGPGSLNEYHLTRRFTNTLYMIFTLKILNSAADATLPSMKNFWKHLHVTTSLKHTCKWITRIHILTLNFYNSPHVDDDSLPRKKDHILDELESVYKSSDKAVRTVFKKQALLYRRFVEDYDCPTPTTCCYQLIYTGSNTEVPSPPKSHYYFLNCGIGSCHRIHNHMTSSFCGSIFQHCTSVPLFTQESQDGTTKLHVGEHPDWTWLAWGGGSNNESDEQEPEGVQTRNMRNARSETNRRNSVPRNRVRNYDSYERNE